VIKLRSSRWSLAVATVLLALVEAAQPATALPDTSVKNLATDAPMVSQVTSVAELTDVNPDTWAFQALRSLVERYGCIEGYPSKVFLGNKALTRYEFAAGLNACLDRVNELIAAGTADLVTRDDLATVQRLQTELQNEYRSLLPRVDTLEAKTKELEANLFSRTTKLDAEVIFQVVGATADNTVRGTNASNAPLISGSSQNVAMGGRVRLNLRSRNVAIRGDQLRVRLNANTGEGSFFNTGFSRVGRFDTLQAQGGAPVNGLAPVSFDKVYYEFPFIANNFRLTIGPRAEAVDYLGTNLNTRSEGSNFSQRVFRRNIAISLVNTSVPSLVATWRVSPQIDLRAYYGATAGGDAFGFGGGGVTGPSQAAVEVGFRPDPRLDLGLGYYRTTCNSSNTAINAEAPSSQNRIFCDASVGGSTRYPFSGSGAIANVQHDTFNAHVDWDIFPEVALFGRYSFGSGTLSDGQAAGTQGSTINYNEWMAGLAFKDPFGQRGNTIGLAVVQPGNLTSNSISAGTVSSVYGGTTFPTSGSSLPDARELEYGFYYRFQVAKGITLTPEAYYITNPGSISSNPNVTIGSLKAVFTF